MVKTRSIARRAQGPTNLRALEDESAANLASEASPGPIKLLLTPQEAADALGIHRSTLYILLLRQELPSITIGRARRIPLRALERWVAAQLGDARVA